MGKTCPIPPRAAVTKPTSQILKGLKSGSVTGFRILIRSSQALDLASNPIKIYKKLKSFKIYTFQKLLSHLMGRSHLFHFIVATAPPVPALISLLLPTAPCYPRLLLRLAPPSRLLSIPFLNLPSPSSLPNSTKMS